MQNVSTDSLVHLRTKGCIYHVLNISSCGRVGILSLQWILNRGCFCSVTWISSHIAIYQSFSVVCSSGPVSQSVPSQQDACCFLICCSSLVSNFKAHWLQQNLNSHFKVQTTMSSFNKDIQIEHRDRLPHVKGCLVVEIIKVVDLVPLTIRPIKGELSYQYTAQLSTISRMIQMFTVTVWEQKISVSWNVLAWCPSSHSPLLATKLAMLYSPFLFDWLELNF